METAITQWAGNIFASFVVGAVVAGLMRLFFTKGTGRDWAGNFIKTAWVFAGLLLIGPLV